MPRKLTQEEFIEKAIEVHGSKYDYSKTNYINNRIKICIICPIHGEFWQEPIHHKNGFGCSKCSNNYKLSTKEFVEKAKIVHQNTYDYSKVKYINNITKVCIICPEHGEFWQTPKQHLKGAGCLKCYYKKRFGTEEYSTLTFINKSKQIHNNKYDYKDTNYINCMTKVNIRCLIHGIFEQTPHEHLDGCGCPICGNNSSNNEFSIFEYIKSLKIEKVNCRDKSIIYPLELDIFLSEYNIGIEYNGVYWHSEKFNKNTNRHVDKLNLCNKNGIKLIQIFEDEYFEHKEIVLSKIKHLLGKDDDLPKIYARKCEIKEIDKKKAKEFLEKNHIQDFVPSTIYLGCFYHNDLIAVMTLKKEKENKWELSRFATDITKRCVGVGSKMFTYFIKNYDPEEVKSFADRRWTLDKDNNLYINLGFKLDKILKPDYRYVNGYKREHKFGYRKNILLKRYPNAGLTDDMTEYEMTQKLGFYRIWDCGLFKYVWKKGIK